MSDITNNEDSFFEGKAGEDHSNVIVGNFGQTAAIRQGLLPPGEALSTTLKDVDGNSHEIDPHDVHFERIHQLARYIVRKKEVIQEGAEDHKGAIIAIATVAAIAAAAAGITIKNKNK